MVLIKGPECEKDVSEKARACPNCGYPIYPFGKKLIRLLSIFFAIMFVVSALNVFLTQ